MAGKIVADTLEHSTAGSLDTSYVVNGSAKAWVNFDGTGTIAARDSLAVSGLVDNGTGDYTISYTSSLANGNYSLNGNTILLGQRMGVIYANSSSQITATGSSRIRSLYTNNFTGGGQSDDQSFVSVQIMGDLA